MSQVEFLSDHSLRDAGFSDGEIQAAANRADCFVGERSGTRYFRAQNELNIDIGDYKTREVRLPGQQGDQGTRPDRRPGSDGTRPPRP